MESFRVRFTPSVLGALGILWAAITGKRVALVVDEPVFQQESETVIGIHSSHIKG